jgi:hypothetical protein
MPYIGNTPADKFLTLAKQSFSTSATTSYTLDSAVSSTQDIALFINNVRQSPVDAYTVSGTALTLTSATAGTDEMYCVYLGKTVGTVSPSSDSVTTAMIQANAVTAAKLNSDVKLGKIGQVIQTTKTDTTSISSSTFAQISGFSVSITPSATSSKILCMVQLNLGNNSTNLYARLMRDTTSIFQSDSASNRPQATYGYTSHGQYAMNPSPIIYMDSPSSTSALAYSVYWRSDGSTTGYMNRTVGDRDTANFDPRGTSSIVVMEVLA